MAQSHLDFMLAELVFHQQPAAGLTAAGIACGPGLPVQLAGHCGCELMTSRTPTRVDKWVEGWSISGKDQDWDWDQMGACSGQTGGGYWWQQWPCCPMPWPSLTTPPHTVDTLGFIPAEELAQLQIGPLGSRSW